MVCRSIVMGDPTEEKIWTVLKDQGIEQAKYGRKDMLRMQDTGWRQCSHWSWPYLNSLLKALSTNRSFCFSSSSLVLIKMPCFVSLVRLIYLPSTYSCLLPMSLSSERSFSFMWPCITVLGILDLVLVKVMRVWFFKNLF